MSKVYIRLIGPAEATSESHVKYSGQRHPCGIESVGTLGKRSIIIARIASLIPGNLMHFHWHRLL